jgi:multicomponent K+:H+ antiporter subunit G
MNLVAEILISLLIVLGSSFALVGSWGLVRLPTLMTRLHAPTKATTLGVGGCLIASMVYFSALVESYSAHELLITLFLFLTAPVSANMIAKAHLHDESQKVASTPTGTLNAALPPTGTKSGWATFWKPGPFGARQ